MAVTRVFPQPGQIGLFMAAADGSDERPLVDARDTDYDAAWAPDGASIVFTSERDGSADLYRVKPDGTGLERLTDSPAYDDQAAFSPDGRQLVFVSTRAGGTADLWTMDLQTRRAKALTSGPGGDFRPSWSPDGQWIAFSSDRASNLPFAHGRWEHLHLVDLYIVHPGRVGTEAPHRARRVLRQPEVDGRQPARARLLHDGGADARQPARGARAPRGHAHRLDRHQASGMASDLPAGPASSSIRRSCAVTSSPTSAGTATSAAFTIRTARAARRARFGRAAWSPGWHAGRVSQAHHVRAQALGQDVEPASGLRADAHERRAVVQSRGRRVRVRRPGREGDGRRRGAWRTSAARRPRSSIAIPARNVLGPAVVAGRRAHHLRHRRVQRVLQRIPRPLPQAGGSRRRRRADRDGQSPTAAASAS